MDGVCGPDMCMFRSDFFICVISPIMYPAVCLQNSSNQIDDAYAAKVTTKANEIVSGIKSPLFMRLEVNVSLAYIYILI
jgi:hypothetical protein